MNIFSILFSFSGKISRKYYWISLIGIYITTSAILAILVSYFPKALVVPIIFLFIGLVSSLSIQVKRCNDIGWHPGFVLLSFIPSFTLIWLLVLGIIESSKTVTSAIDNIIDAINNIKEKYSNTSKASEQKNHKPEEKETIIYCSNCGSKLKENITVCSDCGFQPQSEKNYCYNCGAEVNEKQMRGVAIFAKACFGHPSPSKRQKLNATAMPSAPRFVLVTTSRPNRGSEHWLQMT